MARLDETKQPGNQRQIMAGAAENHTDRLHLIYRERILPKMVYIYTGLGKLCEQMNRQETGVRATYFIEGLGRLENLIQSDYQLSADSLVEINEITLTYRCAAEGELNVYIEGKKNVDMYIGLLKDNNLKYKGRHVKDDTGFVTGARLIISRYVPVSISFRVDIPNTSIEMRIRNYENPGESCLRFSPESITEDFMKNLAEYIARKNRGFFSLDLPEIERRRIRAKVLYEQQQRAAELEAADKMASENAPRKKGLFSRLMGR